MSHTRKNRHRPNATGRKPRPRKLEAGDRVRLRIDKKNCGGMVFPAGMEMDVHVAMCGLLGLATTGSPHAGIFGVDPKDVELVMEGTP
jgi:hypothetical protein